MESTASSHVRGSGCPGGSQTLSSQALRRPQRANPGPARHEHAALVSPRPSWAPRSSSCEVHKLREIDAAPPRKQAPWTESRRILADPRSLALLCIARGITNRSHHGELPCPRAHQGAGGGHNHSQRKAAVSLLLPLLCRAPGSLFIKGWPGSRRRLVPNRCRWPFLAGFATTGYIMVKIAGSVTGERAAASQPGLDADI